MRRRRRPRSRTCTERLVHDPSDGGRATPALRAATEAAVDLTRGARGGSARNRGAHRVVTEHVTRADDHCSRRGDPDQTDRGSIRHSHAKSKGKNSVYSASNLLGAGARKTRMAGSEFAIRYLFIELCPRGRISDPVFGRGRTYSLCRPPFSSAARSRDAPSWRPSSAPRQARPWPATPRCPGSTGASSCSAFGCSWRPRSRPAASRAKVTRSSPPSQPSWPSPPCAEPTRCE